MATTAQIQADVTAAQAVGNTILTTLSEIDPATAPTAAAAEAVMALTASLVSAALTAYSNATGTPITVASVQALLPDSTPLTAPTA